ncbi:hypothetical protein LSAT2_008595 [Lamellibrachia satsuma]|nr:hypothetical protein LSAT2_008595 [Lamellibrachia satsuma]
MKRSRSDVPTGASLFRELKLKRQRLSMLLNRDINDVLSSTSSSDTGDHGSDGDAGPPLMLREDSACFESRRHDAVDSGASSDGDWSFCG